MGTLGEDTPDKLRATVLFLIGINCGMRAGEEHYELRRDGPTKLSQFSFKRNDTGARCVVYEEDTITKTNDGGINSMRKDRKIVWINPNKSDVARCPVRLIDKYMSLVPPVKSETSKHNFYLRSMEKPNPVQWYTSQVVGLNTLRKTVGELLKKSEFDGYFTNHSLRRSNITRLFQAGVDKKLIREISGHRSDAIDKYCVTSHAQRTEISNILAGNVEPKTDRNDTNVVEAQSEASEKQECSCGKNVLKSNDTNQIGEMITKIVNAKKGSKTVVRIEIEFND